MTLSLPERLAMLMPPSVFYRRRIAQEARTGEPELAVLAELVPRGGIAVDVGANVGFFAYALADIADRVLIAESRLPSGSAKPTASPALASAQSRGDHSVWRRRRRYSSSCHDVSHRRSWGLSFAAIVINRLLRPLILGSA